MRRFSLFYKLLEKRFKLTTQHISVDFLETHKEESSPEDKKNIVLMVLIATILRWLTSQWTGIPVAVVSGLYQFVL